MRDLRERVEREQILGSGGQQAPGAPGWTPPGRRADEEQQTGSAVIELAPAEQEGVTSGSDSSEWGNDEPGGEKPKR
jgi:hypothetical protein